MLHPLHVISWGFQMSRRETNRIPQFPSHDHSRHPFWNINIFEKKMKILREYNKKKLYPRHALMPFCSERNLEFFKIYFLHDQVWIGLHSSVISNKVTIVFLVPFFFEFLLLSGCFINTLLQAEFSSTYIDVKDKIIRKNLNTTKANADSSQPPPKMHILLDHF